MSECDETNCSAVRFPQRIPCVEENLQAVEWYIYDKVPKNVRELRPNIERMGGTVYDLWLVEAENIVGTDLLKLSTPIRIEELNNPSQLTRVKAIKACELLFRTNAVDVDDINDKRAAYCASLYQAEFSSIPLRVLSGAQIIPKYGMVRC